MKKIELDELKKIQYDILLYIKEICEKYHIKYFIAYGTLIGAVRHKGFIPWDDDIDIMLLREDYEKFVKAMKEEKHEYYSFCDMRNMERCHTPYGIMEDTRTAIYHERFNNKLLEEEGVYVDIFPLDDLPNKEKDRRKIIRKLTILKACNNLRITKRFSVEDSIIKKIIKRIVQISIKPMGKKYIYNGFCKEINTIDNCIYVGELMCDPNEKNCFRKEIFEETIQMKFEDDYFPVPKRYDEFLKEYYGDYMKLPPESERKSFHEYDFYWRN